LGPASIGPTASYTVSKFKRRQTTIKRGVAQDFQELMVSLGGVLKSTLAESKSSLEKMPEE
jgi:hypothetical protein